MIVKLSDDLVTPSQTLALEGTRPGATYPLLPDLCNLIVIWAAIIWKVAVRHSEMYVSSSLREMFLPGKFFVDGGNGNMNNISTALGYCYSLDNRYFLIYGYCHLVGQINCPQ